MIPLPALPQRKLDRHAARRGLFGLLVLLAAAPTLCTAATPAPSAPGCLPSGDGFFRARLSGAVNAELDWRNQDMECSGSIRPAGDGLRLRFKHAEPTGGALVFVFGITELKEGARGTALPVNVTVIREGSGEFFATQGDRRCTIDRIEQRPLAGIPLRKRSYRVTVRGFCTQPARAVKGDGAILITRFDYAGRVDFETEEDSPSSTL
jgi:hypothetical protein